MATDKKTLKCNKPRRTPDHKTKSHIVKASQAGKEKIIRFGQQGVTTAGKPKSGESAKQKARRASCLLYTSPSPRDRQKSRMPSSA